MSRQLIGLFAAFALTLFVIHSLVQPKPPVTQAEAAEVANGRLEQVAARLGIPVSDFEATLVQENYPIVGGKPAPWYFEYQSRDRPRYRVSVFVWENLNAREWSFRIVSQAEATTAAGLALETVVKEEGLHMGDYLAPIIREASGDDPEVAEGVAGWSFHYRPRSKEVPELKTLVFERGRWRTTVHRRGGIRRYGGEVDVSKSPLEISLEKAPNW